MLVFFPPGFRRDKRLWHRVVHVRLVVLLPSLPWQEGVRCVHWIRQGHPSDTQDMPNYQCIWRPVINSMAPHLSYLRFQLPSPLFSSIHPFFEMASRFDSAPPTTTSTPATATTSGATTAALGLATMFVTDRCYRRWPLDLAASSISEFTSNRAAEAQPPRSSSSFLIGWNPRGFDLCVAAAIVASNVSVANDIIAKYYQQSDHPTSGSRPARGLRVLGKLSLSRQGSPVSPGTSSDDGSKALSREADLWIDLVLSRSPASSTSGFSISMSSLLCCGYPQRAVDLHLLVVDDTVVTLPLGAAVHPCASWSPAARPDAIELVGLLHATRHGGGLSPAAAAGGNVKAAFAAATKATRISLVAPKSLLLRALPPSGSTATASDAKVVVASAWEGTAIPTEVAACVAMLAPSAPPAKPPPLVESRTAAGATAASPRQHGGGSGSGGSGAEGAAGTLDLTSETGGGDSFGDSTGGGPSNPSLTAASVYQSFGAASGAAKQEPLEWRAVQRDPSLPPRLSYPATADNTDLAMMFKLLRAGLDLVAPAACAAMSTAPPTAVTTPFASYDVPRVAVRWLRQARGTPSIGSRLALLDAALRVADAAVVSPGAPFLYFLDVLRTKLREWRHAAAIVQGRAVSCGLAPLLPYAWQTASGTPEREAEEAEALASFAVRAAADSVAGVGFALVLLAALREPVAVVVRHGLMWLLHDVHVQVFDWFYGWPAGFKTNTDLNHALHLLCTGCLGLWSGALQQFQWATPVLLDLVFVTMASLGVLGLSLQIALLADVLNVMTQHLRNLFHLLRVPYRLINVLLSSLMLRFRGRKFNRLKQRVEDVEGSVLAAPSASAPCRSATNAAADAGEEMVMTTLLFTMGVFLVPTIALFYGYLAAVRSCVWLILESLRGIAFCMCYLPVYVVLTWPRQRLRFSTGVQIRQATTTSTAGGNDGASQRPDAKGPGHQAAPGERDASPCCVGSGNTIVLVAELQPLAAAAIGREMALLAQLFFMPLLSPSRLLSSVLQGTARPTVRLQPSAHLLGDPTAVVAPRVIA